ncbi:MAG: hypothetical protein ACPGSB_09080, partial [Opitutales bacterium]
MLPANTRVKLMDAYTFKARWSPALIAFAPLSLAALSWLAGDQEIWKEWGGVIVTTGLGALLVNFARERGKKLEPELFSLWGGKPTCLALRHTSSCPEQATRWRDLLEEETGLKLPNVEEEALDMAAADRNYDVAVKKLISTRRDRKKYPLIFTENCNYGFWRNLIGLKPIGILLTILGIALSGIPTYLKIIQEWEGFVSGDLSAIGLSVFALIVNLLMLIFWVFFARKACVKHAADAYAARLLESLED